MCARGGLVTLTLSIVRSLSAKFGALAKSSSLSDWMSPRSHTDLELVIGCGGYREHSDAKIAER